jgi:hypothetical protein
VGRLSGGGSYWGAPALKWAPNLCAPLFFKGKGNEKRVHQLGKCWSGAEGVWGLGCVGVGGWVGVCRACAWGLLGVFRGVWKGWGFVGALGWVVGRGCGGELYAPPPPFRLPFSPQPLLRLSFCSPFCSLPCFCSSLSPLSLSPYPPLVWGACGVVWPGDCHWWWWAWVGWALGFSGSGVRKEGSRGGDGGQGRARRVGEGGWGQRGFIFAAPLPDSLPFPSLLLPLLCLYSPRPSLSGCFFAPPSPLPRCSAPSPLLLPLSGWVCAWVRAWRGAGVGARVWAVQG